MYIYIYIFRTVFKNDESLMMLLRQIKCSKLNIKE